MQLTRFQPPRSLLDVGPFEQRFFLLSYILSTIFSVKCSHTWREIRIFFLLFYFHFREVHYIEKKNKILISTLTSYLFLVDWTLMWSKFERIMMFYFYFKLYVVHVWFKRRVSWGHHGFGCVLKMSIWDFWIFINPVYFTIEWFPRVFYDLFIDVYFNFAMELQWILMVR